MKPVFLDIYSLVFSVVSLMPVCQEQRGQLCHRESEVILFFHNQILFLLKKCLTFWLDLFHFVIDLTLMAKGMYPMKNIFHPMLFSDLKSYSKKKFGLDLISGIIVAVIALPLSVALAIAAGVAPEAGIYTGLIAGFLTALFGGIPATGAIARTAANIKNGGRTPVSGIVHSVVLLIVLVALMPYAAYIPMPAIAAILISVAYNMCQWRQFVNLLKTAPKSDVLVMVSTFLLTVVFDLVVAIEVGIIMACVLFMKRMSEETRIKSWKYTYITDDESDESLMTVPKHISVYELKGPLFFTVSDQLRTIRTKPFTTCVILRMGAVPMMDTDAIRQIKKFVDDCHKSGIAVILSHVNAQPMKAIKKAGLYQIIGSENFCKNIDHAMRRAKRIDA